MTRIVIVLASMFAASCAATPPVIDYTLIDSIRPATTTKDDVLAMFGEPAEVTALVGGQEEWLYWFQPVPLEEPLGLPAPSDAQRKREVLRVIFSPTGTVWTSDATRSSIRIESADGTRPTLGVAE